MRTAAARLTPESSRGHQAVGLSPSAWDRRFRERTGERENTPPVGTTLFISTTIAGSTMSETIKALWPYFFVAIALLLAITYIPALTIRF